MKIDRDLKDLMTKTPEAVAEVVLCSKASARISDSDLAACGFRVTARQTLADQAFIIGEIQLQHLEKLSAVKGIDAVSSAPEAEIC